jgi:hypothetical protein
VRKPSKQREWLRQQVQGDAEAEEADLCNQKDLLTEENTRALPEAPPTGHCMAGSIITCHPEASPQTTCLCHMWLSYFLFTDCSHFPLAPGSMRTLNLFWSLSGE